MREHLMLAIWIWLAISAVTFAVVLYACFELPRNSNGIHSALRTAHRTALELLHCAALSLLWPILWFAYFFVRWDGAADDV